MKEKSLRLILFYSFVFVFLCLLLSGGSRLIAWHQYPLECVPDRGLSSIPAVLTAMQTTVQENACSCQNRMLSYKKEFSVAAHVLDLPARVLCDANGNVLGQRSYMHEVYQVFSLGDGFA